MDSKHQYVDANVIQDMLEYHAKDLQIALEIAVTKDTALVTILVYVTLDIL